MHPVEGTNPDELAGATALAHRLVANALRYRAAPARDLAQLQRFRHNADLVPLTDQRLKRLLDGLHRDTNITYDMQGLQDQGVDTSLRLADFTGPKFIGLQLKSHKEFVDEDPSNKLIQQYHAAREHFGDDLTYYIVACCDPSVPKVQDRLRNVRAKFSKAGRVAIVDPAYASTFLNLRGTQLDSLVTQVLRSGDPLLVTAREELTSMRALEAAIVLRLVEATLCEPTSVSTFRELTQDPWLGLVCKRARRMDEVSEIAWHAISDTSLRSLLPSPLPERREGEDSSDYMQRVADRFPDSSDLEPERLADLLTDNASSYMPVDDHSLASAIDNLVDSGRVELRDDVLQLTVPESIALVSLAGEGIVRHDFDRRDVITYLVETVLLGRGGQ